MRISAALCVFEPAVFLALLLDSLPELFAVELAHMCSSAERQLVDHAPLASSAAAAGLRPRARRGEALLVALSPVARSPRLS